MEEDNWDKSLRPQGELENNMENQLERKVKLAAMSSRYARKINPKVNLQSHAKQKSQSLDALLSYTISLRRDVFLPSP